MHFPFQIFKNLKENNFFQFDDTKEIPGVLCNQCTCFRCMRAYSEDFFFYTQRLRDFLCHLLVAKTAKQGSQVFWCYFAWRLHLKKIGHDIKELVRLHVAHTSNWNRNQSKGKHLSHNFDIITCIQLICYFFYSFVGKTTLASRSHPPEFTIHMKYRDLVSLNYKTSPF